METKETNSKERANGTNHKSIMRMHEQLRSEHTTATTTSAAAIAREPRNRADSMASRLGGWGDGEAGRELTSRTHLKKKNVMAVAYVCVCVCVEKEGKLLLFLKSIYTYTNCMCIYRLHRHESCHGIV